MSDQAPSALVSHPGGRPQGTHRVPGDKSISHRALLLAAIAEGETLIEGMLEGEDCLATLAAVRALGVGAEREAPGRWRITSRGARAWQVPSAPLDCGNSGTSARLLMGALAAGPGAVTLTGDASLSRRPMRRVADLLVRMGARIGLSPDGHLPATIGAGRRLSPLVADCPVASAQVVGAALLAGVVSGQGVDLGLPAPVRDHSERMLRHFGVAVRRDDLRVRLAPGARPVATRVRVPGDLSSAAFLLAAAAATPGAVLSVVDVGLNPTRTGVLTLLAAFGAEVETEVEDLWGGEPVGRITVRGAGLRGQVIPPALVPLAIDELPLVMVLAGLAEGTTLLRGASELRVKESDRIASVAAGLQALGVAVEAAPDGLRVHGGGLRAGTVASAGDHRVAMAFAVAATAATGPVRIEDTRTVQTSFPGFLAQAQAAGLRLEAAA